MGSFVLHREYTKEEAGEVVGLRYGAPAWRKGIFWFGQAEHAMLFVTLVKEGLPFEYRYGDRFLSPDDFHWQSQNQNSRDAAVGQKFLFHESQGREIHLFVRAVTGERFVYLGTCHFVEWSGDRPFSVWWKLATPVPGNLHVQFAIPPPQSKVLDPDAFVFPEILSAEVGVAREIEFQVQGRDYSVPDSWALTRQRVGGKVFRRAVLENFGGACCVDGLNIRDLLDAAHILPWSEAPRARLDPANGIALCTLHHRAFDSGLMHFLKGGHIAIADPVRVSTNPSTLTHLVQYHESRIKEPLLFPTFLHLNGQ